MSRWVSPLARVGSGMGDYLAFPIVDPTMASGVDGDLSTERKS